MTDWMPSVSPDQMRAVMSRQPLPPPGVPGQIPGATMAPVSSAVAAASAPPGSIQPAASPAPLPVTQQQPQAPPPRPSDDPAISPEMRRALQPTQDANAALDAEQKRVTDLEGQASSLHAPTHDEYKVPLWKKIAAPFVGALAGREAGPVVSSMLNGPFNRATQDYETKSSMLQRQLDAERGINLPLANDRAKVAQEGFRNWIDIKKEGREQTAFNNEPTGRVPIMRQGPDGQPHYYEKTKGGQEIEVPEPREQAEDRRRREEDANTPAPGAHPEPDPTNKGQQRIRTKSGAYIPWSPRTIEEGAMAGDPRATSLFNREHEHPAKDGSEPGSMSASDQREFNAKTRRFSTEIDALNKERAAMIGIEGPFADKRTKAIDTRLDELHGLIDKAETDIMSRKTKGGAQPAPGAQPSGTAFTVPKGAPNPSKPNQDLKMNGKVVAHSVDGKTWSAPK